MSESEYRHSRPAELLETVGGDRNIFKLLIDIFTRDSADQLARMREAMSNNDRAQLAFHTHALKGTVGPTGADALLRQLVDLEAACRDPQGTVAEAVLADIEAQVAAVRVELERFSAGV